MENKSLSTAARRADLLKHLDKNGTVNTKELSNFYSISEVSIRKDLKNLERKGLLIRARGGAYKPRNKPNITKEVHLQKKKTLNLPQKQKIGQIAADLVHDGDTIILDSGTTTLQMTAHLKSIKNLKVITTSLDIALELASFPNIEIILTGGNIRPVSRSLIGVIAANTIRQFFCDKLFLGVDGLDLETGLYTPNIEEASLNRLMIDQAAKVIVLADSSKFNKKSFAFIEKLSRIDVVVTDDKIEELDKKHLQDLGIRVLRTH